ncbi:carboxypeptidase B [Drosophila subobscura]|uniref:carboxypeptidase B n=1 Tax=Drosophila subobscura TaxID=7241 RepID=UPI00155AB22C|nr:carboxypeptidase B [Drosophila subobscura]
MTLIGTAILLLLLLQTAVLYAWQDYKDYHVYELTPRDASEQSLLRQLAREQPQWDFLGPRRRQNDSTVRVMVPHEEVASLVSLSDSQGLEHRLLIDDLAPLVQAQRAENLRQKQRLQLPHIDVLAAFYTHAEINAYLDSLPERYPRRAQVKQFGWSYERRPLKVLTISNGDGRRDKPVILIDGTVHAREWISPSMALYIIQQLLEHFEENQELLQDYDWVIVPVVNADGYEHTHSESRYWRKTRKPTTDPECVGTDINRNFGYEWGHDEGSSSLPCEDIYRGERPFDQPESQVLRDILLTYGQRLTWYLSLHSYGNYFLLPWGYTNSLPNNYEDMMAVADAGAMAIVHATNGIYSYGSTYYVLYPTSGDTADYALGVANATVAMTMELPAGGFLGFDPWVSHIEGIVSESWVGVRAMAVEVIRRYGIHR